MQECTLQLSAEHGVLNIKNEHSAETDGKELNNEPAGNVRYMISILAFFSLLNSMTTRACINVAIVDMVNSTQQQQQQSINDTSNGDCPHPDDLVSNNKTLQRVEEFNWSADQQSQVLAVFYYGYVISQLPGGYIAQRFGSKLIVGWILLSSSILCSASPFLARYDVRALIAGRFFMGLFQGPLYPSIYAIWGLWAPPLERTRLMALASGGAIVGDLLGLALTGVLCSSGVLGGWPLPFYVFGGCSFLCFIVWIFVYDDPHRQMFVSAAEVKYITTQIYGSNERPKFSSPPWKSILTCRPFYGLLLFITMNGMSYYVIFISGPNYMKQVLHFDIAKNGLLNATPYLSSFFSSLAAGPLADFVIARQWMSVTNTRKTFTLIGGLSSAGFILAMGFTACDPKLPVMFLIISWGIGGLVTAGPGISCLDISPQHAGSVMGILNTFSNVGGFISPALVQLLTHGQGKQHQWQNVFFMTAGFTGVASLFYVVLGSSVEQQWTSADESEAAVQMEDPDESQPLLRSSLRQ